ncbi:MULTISPECIES: hypothetical protein [unclassified Nocardioides]|uniref:hypothetical protein n=1 Tax=unclassified Nocardioides TaxID=2615069 RepID=UPI00114DC65B|nr:MULTISPECIES: hypothetical protein [unclassified Nocardioides]TQK71280.1 hypothetical protein FBY23_3069 [Nocardioides sp. SLBN-35]WGY04553.1 hypothetical protein QI633_12460 [Nocardioides sp. QY071]
MSPSPSPDAAPRGDRDVRRAWWCLGLFIPSFLGAFVTGEGLLAVLGYDGEESAPVGVALVAGVPAMTVFALPALLIGHFGRRAMRNGHVQGREPTVVAFVIAGVFVVVNVFQLALLAALG